MRILLKNCQNHLKHEASCAKILTSGVMESADNNLRSLFIRIMQEGASKMAAYLEVDMSDAQELIHALRVVHTRDNFERLMHRVITRTGGKVKRILADEIPQDYEVTKTQVRKAVGAPRMSGGSAGCTIPINGARLIIGDEFHATGGSHGWNTLRRKRYKIKAKMVKGATSVLPTEMTHQGGNPPFRNLGSKLGGATFTRKGQARTPIVRVAGISIPQMPMNRSKEDVQDEIMKFMIERMEHEHAWLIGHCR